MLLMLPLASGCLPAPERYRDTPDINGIVATDGVPSAALRIGILSPVASRSTDADCVHSVVQVTTDQAGLFRAPAHHRTLFPFFLFGESPEWHRSWTLCVAENPKNAKAIWRVLYMGSSDTWKPVRLTCELRILKPIVTPYDSLPACRQLDSDFVAP